MIKANAISLTFALVFLLHSASCEHAKGNDSKIKTLIVDGQNNHEIWPKSTQIIKSLLEETGLFTVVIERTHFTWRGESLLDEYPLENIATVPLPEPKTDPNFAPEFEKYDLVISNFGNRAAPWPISTRQKFETYVKTGGGFVVIHAADNSFPDWEEFNEMIGLGGWGGRDEKSGPYLYYNEHGEKVTSSEIGRGGTHGPRSQFVVESRESRHPIMRGLPHRWMHSEDELYSRLRGPGLNLTVLATAFSDPEKGGSNRHEPVIFVVEYGAGRVFHTTLGHGELAMSSVGFIVTLQRGSEWAGRGIVSQPLPEDFPSESAESTRSLGLETGSWK